MHPAAPGFRYGLAHHVLDCHGAQAARQTEQGQATEDQQSRHEALGQPGGGAHGHQRCGLNQAASHPQRLAQRLSAYVRGNEHLWQHRARIPQGHQPGDHGRRRTDHAEQPGQGGFRIGQGVAQAGHHHRSHLTEEVGRHIAAGVLRNILADPRIFLLDQLVVEAVHVRLQRHDSFHYQLETA